MGLGDKEIDLIFRFQLRWKLTGNFKKETVSWDTSVSTKFTAF